MNAFCIVSETISLSHHNSDLFVKTNTNLEQSFEVFCCFGTECLLKMEKSESKIEIKEGDLLLYSNKSYQNHGSFEFTSKSKAKSFSARLKIPTIKSSQRWSISLLSNIKYLTFLKFLKQAYYKIKINLLTQ